MSEDGGENWEDISATLPLSPVNVIREDPTDENILYLGNDRGVFVSTNKGKNWAPFSKGLTTAAVHDLVIQPEENHLIVGTHGRSIYKADISVLHKLINKDLTIFPPKEVKKSKRWGRASSQWRKAYVPKVDLIIHSQESSAYLLSIKDAKGVVVYQAKGELDSGYNFLSYDLTIQQSNVKTYLKKNKTNALKSAKNGKHYLPKGNFTVEIKTATAQQSSSLTIQ